MNTAEPRPIPSECGIKVVRLVWGQDYAGSSPAIPTIRHRVKSLSQFRCDVGVWAARQIVNLLERVQISYVTPKLIFRQ